MRILMRRWEKASTAQIDEHKARELEKVDQLEREYWNTWERSCKEVEQDDGTTSFFADPRFLTGVQWCIDRRCKLLGLDAPSRSELSGKDGGPIETKDVSELSDEERLARVVAIFDAARARRVE
jgi:hypothetical protein